MPSPWPVYVPRLRLHLLIAPPVMLLVHLLRSHLSIRRRRRQRGRSGGAREQQRTQQAILFSAIIPQELVDVRHWHGRTSSSAIARPG